MKNVFANLYEDKRGRFFKLINTEEEFLEYCQEQDNAENHTKIQKLYKKLEFTEYLEEPMEVIKWVI